MKFSSGRTSLLAFGIGTAAYLMASVGAVAVTARALWQTSVVVFEHLLPSPAASPRPGVAAAGLAGSVGATAPQSVRREGAMSLLAERGYGAWGSPRARMREFAPGVPFGSSSRNAYQFYRSPRRESWYGDEDERPPVMNTYRTVCVRLCDGYYFPVSFAVTPDRLDRDRSVCAGRCGAQGRLFVHPSMDTSTDDMVDLQGRPYRTLPTAFLYRTEYVPSCKCQPDPWEGAALDRHRAYALAAAARKGNKDAAKELQTLQTKMKDDARLAGKVAPPSEVGVGGPPSPAAAARQAEIAKGEDGTIMLLGSGAAPKGKNDPTSPPRPRGDTDWVKRTYDPGTHGR